MLDAAYRMVNPADFAAATRGGRRKGTPRLVVHANTDGGTVGPLVGFVVPKKVLPHAVDRNRTKRRLRHIMRAQIAHLDPHAKIVVRALSGVATASYQELEHELVNCLRRLELVGGE